MSRRIIEVLEEWWRSRGRTQREEFVAMLSLPPPTETMGDVEKLLYEEDVTTTMIELLGLYSLQGRPLEQWLQMLPDDGRLDLVDHLTVAVLMRCEEHPDADAGQRILWLARTKLVADFAGRLDDEAANSIVGLLDQGAPAVKGTTMIRPFEDSPWGIDLVRDYTSGRPYSGPPWDTKTAQRNAAMANLESYLDKPDWLKSESCAGLTAATLDEPLGRRKLVAYEGWMHQVAGGQVRIGVDPANASRFLLRSTPRQVATKLGENLVAESRWVTLALWTSHLSILLVWAVTIYALRWYSIVGLPLWSIVYQWFDRRSFLGPQSLRRALIPIACAWLLAFMLRSMGAALFLWLALLPLPYAFSAVSRTWATSTVRTLAMRNPRTFYLLLGHTVFLLKTPSQQSAK